LCGVVQVAESLALSVEGAGTVVELNAMRLVRERGEGKRVGVDDERVSERVGGSGLNETGVERNGGWGLRVVARCSLEGYVVKRAFMDAGLCREIDLADVVAVAIGE